MVGLEVVVAALDVVFILIQAYIESSSWIREELGNLNHVLR